MNCYKHLGTGEQIIRKTKLFQSGYVLSCWNRVTRNIFMYILTGYWDEIWSHLPFVLGWVSLSTTARAEHLSVLSERQHLPQTWCSRGSPSSTSWQQLYVKSGRHIPCIWLHCSERWGLAPWCQALKSCSNPAATKDRISKLLFARYGTASKRPPALRSDRTSVLERSAVHTYSQYSLPGKCLFPQPDLLQGASSKNWCFGNNFEDSCLVGSQQGEQSKSLEAEDGKLCHWKRKTPQHLSPE